MCGIAGVFNINEEAVSLEQLKKMNGSIAHRGPDGEGYYIDENIGLSHRRLAILDTSSRGAQPMSSKSGNWVIIFNGCIYNFLELKQDLLSKGHWFVTTTDTEIIVEGVDEYGPLFLKEWMGCLPLQHGTKNQKRCISPGIAMGLNLYTIGLMEKLWPLPLK